MNENNQPNSPVDDLPSRLKRAVASEQAPPHLRARVTESIRAAADGPAARSGRSLWMWSATGLATAAMLAGIFLYRQDALPSEHEQESYVATVTSRVSSLMRVGLSDHLHCAIFRKYPKRAPSVETMKRELTPAYAALLDVVQKKVPAELRVVEAHRCLADGRLFVHLVLKNEARTLSVVVARRQDGEKFDPSQLVAGLSQAGIAFYREGAGNFQVAAFEAKSHLVYVISDLPADRNLELMAALAGDLKEALPGV